MLCLTIFNRYIDPIGSFPCTLNAAGHVYELELKRGNWLTGRPGQQVNCPATQNSKASLWLPTDWLTDGVTDWLTVSVQAALAAASAPFLMRKWKSLSCAIISSFQTSYDKCQLLPSQSGSRLQFAINNQKRKDEREQKYHMLAAFIFGRDWELCAVARLTNTNRNVHANW